MTENNSNIKNLVTTDCINNDSIPTNNLPHHLKKIDEGVRNCKKLTPEGVIEVLLRERNLRKSDLASMIGLQKQSLNHYLHGFWVIPTSIKIKIAQALEVDSAVIWDLEERK